MTIEEKKELKDLLLTEAGNQDNEGLLSFVKRTLTADKPQAKIGRVIELLEKV